MPGRKSFKVIPQEKKEFKTEEAIKLRECFPLMGVAHLVLIIMNIFVYKWDIVRIIIDFTFLWFNFYNYMTLNKIIIGIHLGILVMVSIGSLINI